MIPNSDIKHSGTDGTNHIATTMTFKNMGASLAPKCIKLMPPSQSIVGRNQNTIAVARAAPSSPLPSSKASRAKAITTAAIGEASQRVDLVMHNVSVAALSLRNQTRLAWSIPPNRCLHLPTVNAIRQAMIRIGN